MKNASIYIRVSTEHQVKEGYSVAAQKNNLIKFAKDNNFNIYDIYADEGISGKNIVDRPEIKRLISDIEKGLIDAVLIYKFDRLTRNISDTEDFISLIQKYEVTIYTLSEGTVDVSTPQGRFVTRLKGAVAQLEREQTSERIKVAFAQKVKDGFSLCSVTPCYGYNKNKNEKIISINPEEAQIVKKIYQMYIDNYSFTKIAKVLNNTCVPTKMKGRILTIRDSISKKAIDTRIVNSMWQSKTIKIILTNPTYIGKVRYGIGTSSYFETEGKHQAIINNEIWDAVQMKIKNIQKKFRTKTPRSDMYFCGTLLCGKCQHKLTSKKTFGRIKKDGMRKIYKGYRCINQEKGICDASSISHNKVEKAFRNFLKTIDDFKCIKDLVIKNQMQSISEQINDINKSLKLTIKKQKEVMNMFLAGQVNKLEYDYMMSELKIKIISLENELSKLKKTNLKKAINKNDICTRIDNHWNYLADEEKYNFLTKFIEYISIVNQNGDVKILDVNYYS